jgi:hypothetical protein
VVVMSNCRPIIIHSQSVIQRGKEVLARRDEGDVSDFHPTITRSQCSSRVDGVLAREGLLATSVPLPSTSIAR